MQIQPGLDGMLAEFAVLNRRDREFVLAQVGDEAAGKLTSLVSDRTQLELSNPLSELLERIRAGDTPSDVTSDAAAALLSIVDAEHSTQLRERSAKGSDLRKTTAAWVKSLFDGGR